jgi:hypothetical protein
MEVAKWLRTMDLIYGGTKINEDSTATQGNKFRKCYPSDEMQIGQPIVGLPRNFYNARWLQELSSEQLVVLDIQPKIDINFTINERKYIPFCAANPPEIEILLTLNEDMQQNTLPRTMKSRRMGLLATLKQTQVKYHSGH